MTALDYLQKHRPPPRKSWKKVLAEKPREFRKDFVEGLSAQELELIENDWWINGRREQLPPDGKWFLWMILAGRGFGKEVRFSTPILTTKGFVQIQDLQEGDYVFDEAGNPTKVTGVFPQGRKKLYRVHFSDNTFLDAGAEHQWVTWEHKDRKAYNRYGKKEDAVPDNWPTWRSNGGLGPEVRNTAEIYETLRYNRRGDLNHSIPLTKPVKLRMGNLPVDPYFLGYWLGDGSKYSSVIHVGKEDINALQKQLVYRDIPFKVIEEETSYKISIDSAKAGTDKKTGRFVSSGGMHSKLKKMGLLENKHVPKKYLHGSVKQRLELLRGLMDSDGYASASHVEFCTTNERLSDAVMWLATSLGEKPREYEGRATLEGQDCGPKYRVSWRPIQFSPFHLPRKANIIQFSGAQESRNTHRMITDITPAGEDEAYCISVDSPNRMYLAGEALIPTHNTITGSQWVLEQVRKGVRYSVLVGPTAPDTRDLMVLGPSGIIEQAHPDERPIYKPSLRKLIFPNGAEAHLFSADEYERLRGHQGEAIWLDEFAAWRYVQQAWDTLIFGARLGTQPRILITTTPKPIRKLRELLKRGEDTVITIGSTYDNADNLPDIFISEVKRYEGTTFGNQEIHAQLLDKIEGALWTAKMIEATRNGRFPSQFFRVVVGVDPPTSSAGDCGIVIAGEALDTEEFWILDDLTVAGSPSTWGERVAFAAREYGAKHIVAEVNQGGDMVEEVIRQHTDIPVRQVRASKGKIIRAEPISTLYERGCVKHRLEFPSLENEMMYDGTGASPNRLDALVWALTDLAIDRGAGFAGTWATGTGLPVRGITWGSRR